MWRPRADLFLSAVVVTDGGAFVRSVTVALKISITDGEIRYTTNNSTVQ